MQSESVWRAHRERRRQPRSGLNQPGVPAQAEDTLTEMSFGAHCRFDVTNPVSPAATTMLSIILKLTHM